MSADAPVVSVQSGDFEISSNSGTAEEVKASLDALDKSEGKEVKEESPEKKVKSAAAELGKKGGEASAKAREAAKKEEQKAPAPAKAEEKKEPAAEDGEDERPLGKPRHDPRARMLQATHQAAELKRELAARDAELQELRERQQRLEQIASRVTGEPSYEEQKAKQDPNRKPLAEDYDNYEDFVEARARHAARQEFQERQQEAAIVHKAKAYADKVMGAQVEFAKKIEAAGMNTAEVFDQKVAQEIRDLVPSFKLEPGHRPDVSNAIADTIIGAENPAAVMVYLTEHPDAYQRLLASPDYHAVERLMAKIEAYVEGAPAAAPQKAEPLPFSKAKPPVRPLPGSAADAGEPDEDSLSVDAWLDLQKAKKRLR